MASVISRATWTDDDGSGTTGTIINNARLNADVYDKIDAMFAGSGAYTTFAFGGAVQVDGQNLNVRHATNPYLTLTKTNATAQRWDIEYNSGLFRINDQTGGKNAFIIADNPLQSGLYIGGSGVGVGVTASSSYRLYVSTATSSMYAVYINNAHASDSRGLLVDAGNSSSDSALEVRDRIGASSYFYLRGDGAIGFGVAGSNLNISGHNPATSRIMTLKGASDVGIVELASGAADGDNVYQGIYQFSAAGNTGGYKAIAWVAAYTSGTTATNRGAALEFGTKVDGASSYNYTYMTRTGAWTFPASITAAAGVTGTTFTGTGLIITGTGPWVLGDTTGNRGDGTTPLTGTALTIVNASGSWLELSTTAADAASTLVGGVSWNFQSSTDGYEQLAYLSVSTTAAAGTANKRAGTMQWYLRPDNSVTLTNVLNMNAGGIAPLVTVTITGGGLVMGSPTGGDKGAGTINVATDLYKNNTAYTNPAFVFEKIYTGTIDRFADRARKIGLLHYQPNLKLEDIEFYVKTNFDLPLMSELPEAGLFDRGDLLLATVEEAYWHLFRLHDRVKHLESRLTA